MVTGLISAQFHRVLSCHGVPHSPGRRPHSPQIHQRPLTYIPLPANARSLMGRARQTLLHDRRAAVVYVSERRGKTPHM